MEAVDLGIAVFEGDGLADLRLQQHLGDEVGEFGAEAIGEDAEVAGMGDDAAVLSADEDLPGRRRARELLAQRVQRRR